MCGPPLSFSFHLFQTVWQFYAIEIAVSRWIDGKNYTYQRANNRMSPNTLSVHTNAMWLLVFSLSLSSSFVCRLFQFYCYFLLIFLLILTRCGAVQIRFSHVWLLAASFVPCDESARCGFIFGYLADLWKKVCCAPYTSGIHNFCTFSYMPIIYSKRFWCGCCWCCFSLFNAVFNSLFLVNMHFFYVLSLFLFHKILFYFSNIANTLDSI